MNEKITLKTDINLTSKSKQTGLKFTQTNVATLATHGVNLIISVFVSTFLISYIYSVSSNYVLNVGLFYMCHYLIMGVFYYILSNFIDRTNRVVFYRIAIVIRAIFIVCVIFIGKDLAKYVALAGILNGFSEAFYWTSYNIMKNELVSKSLMKKYSTFQLCIEKTINIIIPLILGKIIDADSFKTAAIFVLIVVVIQIICSFFINSHRPDNSSFSYHEFIKNTKNLGEKKFVVKKIIIIGGYYGFITIISPLITIITMIAFDSNFSLGVLTSVFAVCSMIFVILFNKFSKPGKRNWAYILAAILPVISAFCVIIDINKFTIVIFNLCYTVCAIVHTYSYDVIRNFAIKKLDMYGDIAEFQCSIECTMEFCRTFIFLFMVIVGIVGEYFGTDGILIALKVLLGVTIFSMPLTEIALLRLEKRLKEYDLI